MTFSTSLRHKVFFFFFKKNVYSEDSFILKQNTENSKQPCRIETNFIFPNFDLENKPIFLLKVWKLFFLFWVLLYNDKSFRVSVANILLAPGYGHIRWRVASFLSLKIYFSNFDLKNEPIWKLFPPLFGSLNNYKSFSSVANILLAHGYGHICLRLKQ